MQESEYSLARQLIANLPNLDKQLQLKVLEAVNRELQADPNLLTQAIRQQVRLMVNQARDLYSSKQQIQLEQLLQTCDPAAAVMLNIEISLVNESYMEEGATLSRTLLPYLNQVEDYRFLGEDTTFIANRFLSTLITHISDTGSSVKAGFILFGLHLNPRMLQTIINNNDNRTALRQALTTMGYPLSTVNLMTLYPSKFLWQGLL